MAELFGFSIKRTQKELGTNEKSFVSPAPDDGSIEIAGGGFFGQVFLQYESISLCSTGFIGLILYHAVAPDTTLFGFVFFINRCKGLSDFTFAPSQCTLLYSIHKEKSDAICESVRKLSLIIASCCFILNFF